MSQAEKLSFDCLPEWTFYARAQHEIYISELKLIVAKVILENFDNIDDEFIKKADSAFENCFWNEERLISMHQYSRFIKRFDRAEFKSKYIELTELLDSFCFQLKARVSLAMHSDKIDTLVQLMKDNNIQIFRPWMFRKLGKEWLKSWFWTYCRDKDGKVDWYLVYSLVNEKYPCQFEYMEIREKFTKDFALEKAREILSFLIAEKWEWTPAWDLERLDKWIYMFLTSLPEYRREAKRPDLEMKWFENTWTRPNWYMIAKDLWEEYYNTMRIWVAWWWEIEYRSYDDAVEELIDTIEMLWVSEWSASTIYENNVNLYAWFKNHYSKENEEWINWNYILKDLPLNISRWFVVRRN